MSNTTLAATQIPVTIKDSNGRPIFMNFNDGGTSGFAETILGFPVKLEPVPARSWCWQPVHPVRSFGTGLHVSLCRPRHHAQVEQGSLDRVEPHRLRGLCARRRRGHGDSGTHPVVTSSASNHHNTLSSGAGILPAPTRFPMQKTQVPSAAPPRKPRETATLPRTYERAVR